MQQPTCPGTSLTFRRKSQPLSVTVTVPSIPGVGAIQEDGQPDYTVAIRLVRRSEEAQP